MLPIIKFNIIGGIYIRKITKVIISASLSLGILLNIGTPAFAAKEKERPEITIMKKIQKETSRMDGDQKRKYYDKVLTGIVKEAKKEKTVVGQIKVIHDRLASRITYDYATADGTKGATDESFKGIGAIVNGKGVCNAYAQVLRDTLDKAGIPNKFISDNRMDHTWNLVKVDGLYYHIDLTWDDSWDGDIPRYRYFLVNDKKIQEDHKTYKPKPQYKATSAKYHAFGDYEDYMIIKSDRTGISYLDEEKGFFHVNLNGKVTAYQKFTGYTQRVHETSKSNYFQEDIRNKRADGSIEMKYIIFEVPKSNYKQRKILFESGYQFDYTFYSKYVEIGAYGWDEEYDIKTFEKLKINL